MKKLLVGGVIGLLLLVVLVSGCTSDTPKTSEFNYQPIPDVDVWATGKCPECGGNSHIKTETDNFWGSECNECGHQFLWTKNIND